MHLSIHNQIFFVSRQRMPAATRAHRTSSCRCQASILPPVRRSTVNRREGSIQCTLEGPFGLLRAAEDTSINIEAPQAPVHQTWRWLGGALWSIWSQRTRRPQSEQEKGQKKKQSLVPSEASEALRRRPQPSSLCRRAQLQRHPPSPPPHSKIRRSDSWHVWPPCLR